MKGDLKFWTGSTTYLKGTGHAWEAVVIAAYSVKDAVQLYVEAGGREMGAASHVRTYMGHPASVKIAGVPVERRGIYFTDESRSSVMFQEPKTRTIPDDVPEGAIAAASAQATPEDYGALRTGFTKGINVDVWTYNSPHHDRAHGDQMTAQVRLEPSRRRARGGAEGMTFVARSKCFAESLESPNIDTLFDRVQEAFRTFDLAQRGIVWEDWLQIVIDPTDVYGKAGSGATDGLAVGYSIIKRGIDPRNGKAYTIHDHGSVLPFPTGKAAGAEDPDVEFGKRNEDQQYAYLPDTPENRAALDLIVGRLGALRTRLAALLEQKVIGVELLRAAKRMEGEYLLIDNRAGVSPSESG